MDRSASHSELLIEMLLRMQFVSQPLHPSNVGFSFHRLNLR
jgi:hypothetical protein